MLTHPPLRGSFPVILPFGGSPEVYANVNYGGVALRGHNGIDFQTPVGTPVQAVQDGNVLEFSTVPNTGFGRYILLQHEWGHTLYAHLSQVAVHAGQRVSGGQQIGLTGNSGSSSGAHLHFGLRVAPFSLSDGWAGYLDPEPCLHITPRPPLGPRCQHVSYLSGNV
ncbi:MAG: M23 family metallopeptidase, partial [Chloroflexota bacterium]